MRFTYAVVSCDIVMVNKIHRYQIAARPMKMAFEVFHRMDPVNAGAPKLLATPTLTVVYIVRRP